MANTKIKATAELFLDTSNASKDAKKFVDDLKKKLESIETAADKMTVFQDLVGYIAQIDKSLAALKAKNGDAFNHMFDGMDASFRAEFEKIFGIAKGKLAELNSLRTAINNATSQNTSAEQLKEWESKIKEIYSLMGQNAALSGRGKFETRIKNMKSALDDFAHVWKNTMFHIEQGFTFGGSGVDSSGDGIEDFSDKIDIVKKKIQELESEINKFSNVKKELEKAMKVVDNFNTSGDLSKDLQVEMSVESVRNLMTEYLQLSKVLKNQDATSEEYYSNLIKQSKLAMQIVDMQNKLQTAGTDNKTQNVAAQLKAQQTKNGHSLYSNFNVIANKALDDLDVTFRNSYKHFIQNFQKQQNELDKLYVDLNGMLSKQPVEKSGGDATTNQINKNKELANSYEELVQKIKEYAAIQDKINAGITIDDSGNNLEEQSTALNDFIVTLDKTGNKVQEIQGILGDLAFGDIDVDGAIKQLSALLNITEKITEGAQAVSGGQSAVGRSGVPETVTANVDFTTLENTIKSEASSLSQKLDNILKVELVKDDTNIQEAINGIKTTIDKISASIDNYKMSKDASGKQAEIDAMKANLTHFLKFVSDFNAKKDQHGTYQDQEIGAAILSDGSISTTYGEKGTVPWDRMASSLVANLTKSLLVDVHSHPWAQFPNGHRIANDHFSGSYGDLGAFRFSKELGAQLGAMITGNVMRVFDVSKLTDAQMVKFKTELAKIEKTYSQKPEYSKYMSYDDQSGKVKWKMQGSFAETHKLHEAYEGLMYKALEKIGFSKQQINDEIFQKYNLTDDQQLTALAERLVTLSHASQNALSPVERLTELISKFGGDVNSEKAKEGLAAYQKGELSAAAVFNGVMKESNKDIQISQKTLDSLLTIDTAKDLPAVESLLTQVIGVLNSISANVANISSSTRQSTSDRFDMAMNDLLDLREGVDIQHVLSEIESIFDPLNVSKYKNNEVLQISDNSVLDATDYINDLFAKSMRDGSVDIDEAQIALDKFYLAVSHVQDAIKQIDLYEKRTGQTYLDKQGNVAKDNLNEVYNELINDNYIQELLYLLSQAKIDISKYKDVYKDGLGKSENTYNIDNDQITSHLQVIQSTLDSIYGALRGFTGIESDNKNSLKYKEPIVDSDRAINDFSEQDLSVLNSILQVLGDIESHIYMYTNKSHDTPENTNKDIDNDSDLANFIRAKLSQQFATEETLQMVKAVVDSLYTRLSQTDEQKKPDGQDTDNKQKSDVYQLLANRLPTNIATEDTLIAIKSVLEQIAELSKNKDEDKEKSDIQENLGQLVNTLTSAVQNLQNVANGIVQHQKAQKTDTSAAMARITDPQQHQQISDIARNAVGTLGSEVEIKSLKALSNGLVRVEGAFKNVNGEWEGFTVKVNEANAAVDLAIDKQSAFAKTLNKTQELMSGSDEEKPVQYTPEETYKKALAYMRMLNEEGKNATLQYKDNGRYTVSTKEIIGGLSKEMFQTFDEFQENMSRTTVTMSNNIASSIKDANKLISDSADKVGNADLLTKYNTEYANLIAMNQKYEAMDNLGQSDIDAWNQQITLVQRLGAEISSLIKQQEKLEGQTGLATSAKRLQEYQAKANQFFKDTKIDLNAENKTPEQQKIVDLYDQIIERVDTLRKSHAVLTDSQVQDINRLISSLQNEADAYVDVHGLRKDAKKPKTVDPNKELKKTRKELLDDTEGKLRGTFNTLDFKIDTKNLSAEQQKIADEYKELSDIIKKYGRDASQVSKQDFDATLQRVSALQKEIDAYKEKYNIINGRGGTKSAYGKTAAVNAQAKFNTLQGRAKPYIEAGSTVVNDSLVQYEASLKRLIALQSQFKSGQDLSPDQLAHFTQLKNECNAYGQALKKVLDESDRLMANGSKPLDLMDDISLDTFADRSDALKEYIQDTYGASAAIGKLNSDATQLSFVLKNGDGTITNMTASLNAARTAIVSISGDTQQATTAFGRFFNELGAKARSISTYLLSMTGIEEVFQQVRNGVQYVREIDSALTELKKVTNETGAAYDQFLQDMSKTAGTVGSTVKDLTNMAAEWSRLGYSMEEAGKLAESTAVLLNVSEFTDATQASEALISTMQAFQYTADDSQHVVDVLNEVGKLIARR